MWFDMFICDSHKLSIGGNLRGNVLFLFCRECLCVIRYLDLMELTVPGVRTGRAIVVPSHIRICEWHFLVEYLSLSSLL